MRSGGSYNIPGVYNLQGHPDDPAPEEIDIDELLQEGVTLSPVPEYPSMTSKVNQWDFKDPLSIYRDNDFLDSPDIYDNAALDIYHDNALQQSYIDMISHGASNVYEENQAELYSFEDFTPQTMSTPGQHELKIYSDKDFAPKRMSTPGGQLRFHSDQDLCFDYSILPNHVNGREFVRAKTLATIPLHSLSQLNISEYEEDLANRRQRDDIPPSRTPAMSSSSNRLLRHRPSSPPSLPGQIRTGTERNLYSCLRKKTGTPNTPPILLIQGTAWAPEDEEDEVLYDPLSPDDLASPSTAQFYYTTPPRQQQMASPSGQDGRSRLDRSSSAKGGLSRLARRLSQKEKRSANEERRKTLRQRSVSLDCGDGRRQSLMTATTPEPQDQSSLCIPSSPSLPSKLSRSNGSSSPNLALRLSRRASGSRNKKSPSELTAEGALGPKGDKKRRSFMDIQALFEAVEQQDMDKAKSIIENNGLDVNYLNNEDLTPLDIAIMSNHVPMAKMLIAHGGRENPKFQRVSEARALTLINLLNEAERYVCELSELVATGQGNVSREQVKENERLLGHWEFKHKLLKKMKQSYDSALHPDAPTNVTLSVASCNSLLVKYDEPLNNNGAVVTRYKVEWSENESFSPLAGEQIVEDLRYNLYEIPGLNQGQVYYVRVRAWNMKGFGPAALSNPPYAIPSSWREVESLTPRHDGKLDLLDTLFSSIKNARPADASEIKDGSTPSGSPMHPRKSNMRRSLKNLFASAPKFQKTLKRGVYFASLLYNDDRILVTNEEYLPILEVDENFTGSTLYSDFHWLMKIACTWDDVKCLRNDIDRSGNSSTMLFRAKLLQAAAQMQSALGVQDLGKFFHKPIRDENGTIMLVTINNMRDTKMVNTNHARWIPLPKIQKRMSSSIMDTISSHEKMLMMLPEMISYQTSSCTPLPRGLYLGYLKLKSSVDLIKIMVPQKTPNVLPNICIRDNPNVSKEEWDWLRQLSVNDATSQPSPGQIAFQDQLVRATKHLLESLDISEDEAVSHRLYDLEVIEISDDVSFLLLIPPIEAVCSVPGHSEQLTEKPQFLKLPVQVFEMVHMCTYQYEFMSRYSRLSSILEMDMYLAQQAQREAFSTEEINAAKERVEMLGNFQQRLDETWKSVRWVMDIITYARDKNIRGGLPLSILYAPPPSPADSPNLERRDSKDADTVISSASSDMGYHSDRSCSEPQEEHTETDEILWMRKTPLPGILRVYAAYETGLARGTSVKLHVTPRTSSREVINLVVQQLNRATMLKGLPGPLYNEEQLPEFCLAAVVGARERVLRDDFQPLQLQNPWTRGRLFVRLKRDTLAALEQGHVTSV